LSIFGKKKKSEETVPVPQYEPDENEITEGEEIAGADVSGADSFEDAPTATENGLAKADTSYDEIMKVDTRSTLAMRRYQERSANLKRAGTARACLIILYAVVCLLTAYFFTQIASNLASLYPEYGKYIGIAIIAAYVILMIVLSVIIFRHKAFIIDSDSTSREQNSRHNRRLRREVLMHIIDMDIRVGNLSKDCKAPKGGLELEELTDRISDLPDIKAKCNEMTSLLEEKQITDQQILAVLTGWAGTDPKERDLKGLCTKLPDSFVTAFLMTTFKKGGTIYNNAKKTVMRASLTDGSLTAIAQTKVADAAITSTLTVQMIVELVYLYGFRPSDSKLNGIILRVLRNVAFSIGLNDLPWGGMVEKVTGRLNNHIATQLISALIDSGVQFLINGTLTYFIGQTTVSFLLEDYLSQDMLAGDISEYEMEEESAMMKNGMKKIVEDRAKQQKQKMFRAGKVSFRRKNGQDEIPADGADPGQI